MSAITCARSNSQHTFKMNNTSLNPNMKRIRSLFVFSKYCLISCQVPKNWQLLTNTFPNLFFSKKIIISLFAPPNDYL